MNSRSLALAAATLLAGIGIGLVLRDPPQSQSPGAPPQASSGAGHSDPLRELASTLMANPTARSATAAKPEKPEARAAERPQQGVGSTPEVDLALEGSRPGDGESRSYPEYRDDTFGPDEPGLPFPAFVDEDAARDDFERYADGPTSPSRQEIEEGTPTAGRPSEDTNEGFEAEGCLPAFSPCRRDTDCCGRSACRSRPGSISGHFECTAD